jgi:hypothetical protein
MDGTLVFLRGLISDDQKLTPQILSALTNVKFIIYIISLSSHFVYPKAYDEFLTADPRSFPHLSVQLRYCAKPAET